MSTCLMTEAAGYFGEQYFPTGEVTLRETAALSEAFTIVRGVNLADVGTLAEAYAGRSTLTLRDTPTITDAYVPFAHPKILLADVGTFRDGWKIKRGLTLADTATVTDAYIPERATTLRDVGTLADTFTPVRHATTTLRDALRASEKYRTLRTGKWADSAGFAEGWSARRKATLADAGTFTDAWHPNSRAGFLLADTLRAADAYAVRVTHRAMLADELFIDDAFALPGESTTGWTANTDTFAMSRYTDWPINSLGVINGVLYGASDDGLYRLDAPDDAGTPIDASFTTGLNDSGSEATKHTRMIYAGATTDGALQATVYDVTKGVPGVNTYLFEGRVSQDFSPQRCKLGRGIQSRYLQYTIGNVAGSDFTIDTLSQIADAGSRRV